jgi:mannosyl-oligosaccharide alpha-1,2-mannosidase
MMKLAWNGYVQYAWGDNELKPITKVGHSGSIFGRAQLGASIVDAADTFVSYSLILLIIKTIIIVRLYIMDLQPEFTRAKEWIREKFSLRESTADLSLFETNIRFIGGLLSIYALTKEQVNLLYR